jgi:hypothetical protein
MLMPPIDIGSGIGMDNGSGSGNGNGTGNGNGNGMPGNPTSGKPPIPGPIGSDARPPI